MACSRPQTANRAERLQHLKRTWNKEQFHALTHKWRPANRYTLKGWVIYKTYTITRDGLPEISVCKRRPHCSYLSRRAAEVRNLPLCYFIPSRSSCHLLLAPLPLWIGAVFTTTWITCVSSIIEDYATVWRKRRSLYSISNNCCHFTLPASVNWTLSHICRVTLVWHKVSDHFYLDVCVYLYYSLGLITCDRGFLPLNSEI